MKYLLMMYYDEKVLENMGREEELKIEGESRQYSAQLQAEGKYLGGNRLQSVTTATCVRTQDGKKFVTDGPFAETKEQLGGFCLIEATDLDEAIEIATRMKSGDLGTVEIRPILDFAT